MNSLVEELLTDHAWLRGKFDRAETQSLSSQEVADFGRRLSEHIRKEERRLFERLQQLMSGEELGEMGARLETALRDSEQACTLPRRVISKSDFL